jgi:hypothetical protein
MKLNEGQIAFINEMKSKGYFGCSITLENNTQIYISFINNEVK